MEKPVFKPSQESQYKQFSPGDSVVKLSRSVMLGKEHRQFLDDLRSEEDFNFSSFVRDKLEEKMDEKDWEYEEPEPVSKPKIIFKDEEEI